MGEQATPCLSSMLTSSSFAGKAKETSTKRAWKMPVPGPHGPGGARTPLRRGRVSWVCLRQSHKLVMRKGCLLALRLCVLAMLSCRLQLCTLLLCFGADNLICASCTEDVLGARNAFVLLPPGALNSAAHLEM